MMHVKRCGECIIGLLRCEVGVPICGFRRSVIVNDTPYLNGLLRVAVFNTGSLFTESVHTMCIPGSGLAESPDVGDATDAGRPEWQSAALILVVLRLGLEGINPEYIPSLQRMLAIPHCIGLLGGTPRHSIYCVGTAGDDVLFLDPHTTQRAWTPAAPACSEPSGATAAYDESYHKTDSASARAADVSSASPACVGLQAPPEMPSSYINSFRCHRPLFTPLKSLDPSLAIALHCRNRKEFDELCVELQAAFSADTIPPLFSVSAVEPVYEDTADEADVMYYSDRDDAHVSHALNPQESSYFGPTGAGTDALTLDTPFVFQEEPSDDEGYVMVHTSMVTNDI